MPKKSNNIEVTPAVIKKFKELRRSVGLKKFNTSADRSYIQWKDEAENLVIRVFGERSNQHVQFSNINGWFNSNQPVEPRHDQHAAYKKVQALGYSETDIENMSDAEWNKILKGKRILDEINEEYQAEYNKYLIKSRQCVNQLKDKMKDAFTAWIKELELFTSGSALVGRKGNKGIHLNAIQTQNVNLNINIDQAIDAIINEVKASEPDGDKVQEAEAKLSELKKEIKAENPQWSKIKSILEWSLNFSRDVFLKILPILVDKYLKGQ